MNIHEPVTNPALIEAIAIMREKGDNDAVNNMINAVMEARFLAPAEMQAEGEPDEHGAITLKQDTPLRFYTLQTPDQAQYLMAFTDWEQLHRWKKDAGIQTVVMSFDDYAALISQEGSTLAGFVINGFGGNLPFPKELVMSLKEQKELMQSGHSEHKVGKDEQVTIGEPADYPQEMVDAIRSHLENVSEVMAAYLQLMMRGEEASWLILVDFEGDHKNIFDGIAEKAQPFLKDRFLDMMPIDGLGEGALDDVKPFYAIDGYKKPQIKNPSIAIIEETFAMKEKGCVLGCAIKQGEFCVKDEVSVIDIHGNEVLRCVIDAMENESGTLDHIEGGDDVKAGLLLFGNKAEDFKPGYRLVRINHIR